MLFTSLSLSSFSYRRPAREKWVVILTRTAEGKNQHYVMLARHSVDWVGLNFRKGIVVLTRWREETLEKAEGSDLVFARSVPASLSASRHLGTYLSRIGDRLTDSQSANVSWEGESDKSKL